MKEMKNAFDHFDKNEDGKLDHFEFRACLVSLGYNVDTEEHLANHVSINPVKMIGHQNINFNLILVNLYYKLTKIIMLFCNSVIPVFMLRWPIFFNSTIV